MDTTYLCICSCVFVSALLCLVLCLFVLACVSLHFLSAIVYKFDVVRKSAISVLAYVPVSSLLCVFLSLCTCAVVCSWLCLRLFFCACAVVCVCFFSVILSEHKP